ncbi:unnamed protein product [Spodoptera exigua]|nr:unnamed protein product [Spodoptera exigua]
MKICVAILLSTICFVNGFSTKRCLLFNKKCVSHCPRNMHPYHTRCDGETMSQRTCDDPNIYVIGYTCGWSRCDCNADLALDENTGDCVPYNSCPLDMPRARGVSECPEHMHRVNSECRPTPSQRSCDEPVAISMGIICGWSRCDCDFPFVLHLPSGYCFLYEDCP